MPLSQIYKMLREGKIRLDDKKAKPDTRVTAGQRIILHFPSAPQSPQAKKLLTSHISLLTSQKLLTLYESPHILVINKPAGVDLHNGPQSLAAAALRYLEGKLPPSLSFKPGPLHRLDRPTSGIVLFSKSLTGAQIGTRLFREGLAKKTYLALLEGRLLNEETWDFRLRRDEKRRVSFQADTSDRSGRRALSTARPIRYIEANNGETLTLAEVEIKTGLTHQIRASAAITGHPLAGDRKYGGTVKIHYEAADFYLHAWKLELPEAEAAALRLPRQLIAEPPIQNISTLSV
jgi:23S rRNA pseudouridine955/2504/2580 synthase